MHKHIASCYICIQEIKSFKHSIQDTHLQRDYIQNGTHHSGMWGCWEGQNPKFQSFCPKKKAAQAPTPPQNNEFCIICHLI